MSNLPIVFKKKTEDKDTNDNAPGRKSHSGLKKHCSCHFQHVNRNVYCRKKGEPEETPNVQITCLAENMILLYVTNKKSHIGK